MAKLEKITPRDQDFGKWYTDVVKQAELMIYGPAKGTMIIEPNGFAIWENIQNYLDKEFKKLQVKNVSLPSFFPKSFLEKEKEHIDGFAPEVLQITIAGNETLAEPFVVRPTSEVIFAHYFSHKINSYNDLPMKLNQWCSVVRWEKRTNPFLRSTEFLWQEGHTCHDNGEEADEMSKTIINLYAKFAREILAIPVIVGEKTEKERFAGALKTYTIEAIMHNGYALQSGTSHYLGQGFAKASDIKFQSKDNKMEYVSQSSWGVSTRLIGAIIMTHGDDRGLVLPPAVAPVQVAILELFGNKDERVGQVANQIATDLKDFRVEIDNSSKGPGYKAAQQEIKGTPVRIEVGPRDLEEGLVTIVRRDTLEKQQVKIEMAALTAKKIIEQMPADMIKAVEEKNKERIVEVTSYDELKKQIEETKFVLAPFDGSAEDEQKIKDETTASTRCIPFGGKQDKAKCIITGKDTTRWVYFSKAY